MQNRTPSDRENIRNMIVRGFDGFGFSNRRHFCSVCGSCTLYRADTLRAGNGHNQGYALFEDTEFGEEAGGLVSVFAEGGGDV